MSDSFSLAPWPAHVHIEGWPVPASIEDLLDHEFLRSHGAVPHYFGLGFIQVKLDAVHRLHAWVPDWPAIPGAETELHDHRYPFTSHVLKGCIEHDVFAIGPLQDRFEPGLWEVASVSCQPGSSEAPRLLGHAAATLLASVRVGAGQSYALTPDAFHRARAHGPIVSLLVRRPTERAEARILRTPGAPSVCPFSLDVSVEKCWEGYAQAAQTL